MPELSKVQKKLIDKVRNCSSVVILSRYSRNPYLWEYFINEKPRVSRISDRVINGLLDYGVFESVRQRVEEEEQVDMMLSEYKLQKYIEERAEDV